MYAFIFYRFGYPANVVFTPRRACPSGGEAVHYCCQILYILIYQKLYIVIYRLQGRAFLDKSVQKEIKNCCESSLKALEKDLKKVERKLDEVIRSDEELDRLFNLVTSVEGIGPVTAREIIMTTNEFKTFTNPKKYACYAGVVPFPYRSGSSIRGRNKVSHVANKSVKTLLHMSALSSIRNCQEMKKYYERKTQEGKHVMSVINAVRNKLVLRVFAVVKKNQKYEKNYMPELV